MLHFFLAPAGAVEIATRDVSTMGGGQPHIDRGVFDEVTGKPRRRMHHRLKCENVSPWESDANRERTGFTLTDASRLLVAVGVSTFLPEAMMEAKNLCGPNRGHAAVQNSRSDVCSGVVPFH